MLKARRPIIYRSRMYEPGDTLPTNDRALAELWIKYGSAVDTEAEAGSESEPETNSSAPIAERETALDGEYGKNLENGATELMDREPDTPQRAKSSEKEMSLFKDVVAHDVRRTFLHDREFGETHEINGRKMVAIVDNNEQIEREKRFSDHIDGTYANEKLIYVAAKDFGALPSSGGSLKFDGMLYRVLDAIDEMGVYSITIAQNRARGR